mgnify:CR=1 FL=1
MIRRLMTFGSGIVASLLLLTGSPPAAGAQEESETPRTRSDTAAETEDADRGAGAASGGEPLHIEIYKRVSRPVIDGNRVDRFGKQVTAVSARQIEDLNAQDLPSALRRTPGVVISRHNPIGSFGGGAGGAVFIRGMGTERPGAGIQTLIDGVPVFVGVWTHPRMDLLSIDIVERMDVHKGAEPLRFGNMAFGAVNLIPKRQTEEGYSGRLRLAGGSYSTFFQTAEQGGRRGPLDWYLVQSYRTSGIWIIRCLSVTRGSCISRSPATAQLGPDEATEETGACLPQPRELWSAWEAFEGRDRAHVARADDAGRGDRAEGGGVPRGAARSRAADCPAVRLSNASNPVGDGDGPPLR